MNVVSTCTRSVIVLGAVCALAPVASAQTLYLVRKSQVNVQTNAEVNGTLLSVRYSPPPTGTYVFTAQAPGVVDLTLPAGNVQTLPASTAGGRLLAQSFTTQTALDAAFPNGTYRMSGASSPELSFTLTPESYPGNEPIVLRTNWSNGLMVVDPGNAAALSFGGTPSYASASAGAHMSFSIVGLSDNVNLKTDIWSRAVFGFPATPGPLTSFVVPGGTLTAGRVYRAELVWDIATTAETSLVQNAGVIAAYSKVNRFFLVARAPSDPVPAAPVIATQPSSQRATVGGTATFDVAVSIDGAPVTSATMPAVVWYYNSEPLRIDGTKYALANGVGLTIRNVAASDAGRYFAHIVNPGGLVTTLAVPLTVGSPAISRQPASVMVATGDTAVFSVVAAGSPAPTYRWRLNGTNLPDSAVGANTSMLLVPNATTAQAGDYTVVVTSGANTVISSPARLVIAPSRENIGRLVNLSILTSLAAGESMSMGTVLGGGGTSGSKALLARAAGPSLAQLGVSGFLPDPVMVLLNTARSPAANVATNDDWRGDTALSTAFAAVGAFPYTSAASKDAAIVESALPPGNYAVQVQDSGRGSGTVIAELYDSTPGDTFSPTTPRLINVSVLKAINAGASLTAGFVIGGATAKTVLVRAIGPGLGALGVGGAMSDPQLTLTSTSVPPVTTIASNGDWGGEVALTTSSARVGAFAISSAGSRDAMILATLAPGNYAAEVAPANGTPGGMVIVEVYEVP